MPRSEMLSNKDSNHSQHALLMAPTAYGLQIILAPNPMVSALLPRSKQVLLPTVQAAFLSQAICRNPTASQGHRRGRTGPQVIPQDRT